ncbi:MAG: ABC transporter permease [Acidimicrobiia bacterium]|nr:ABC transporter permease [Acidimicrobiia bacterium]MDH3471439.1 ABC transporter permease [Acidimicrobiia bacterium]
MTAPSIATRVLPPLGLGSRRAIHLVERNLRVYRQLWLIVFSGFFEPVFYLFSISIGIEKLVGDISIGSTAVRYAAWAAPALLAASAMNGAIFESTMNIFFKLKYGKIYDGMLATPIGPGDIAIGEITWSLIRGGLYSTAFIVVMAVMGLISSPWGILALPAALLIGFAFAAVGMAATTYMRSWQDLDLVTLATLPLFLFSATFYPLSLYPGWLQAVARFSPLYHGVELCRALTLGIFDWSVVGHVAFLVALGTVGLTIAGRRIAQLLLK